MDNKLFDLQFVIGVFFTLVGTIVFVSSFFATANISYARAINLYSGAGLALFGFVMLLLFISEQKIIFLNNNHFILKQQLCKTNN